MATLKKKADVKTSSICCDNVLCKKRDRAIFDQISMPIVIEFCGNLLFDNIVDIRYLYIRVFFFIYSSFIIIWNFIRFAEQGYAPWWPIYFTQWFSLFTTFYFGGISIVHFNFSQYIKKYENLANMNAVGNDSHSTISTHINKNNNGSKYNPNCDLSIEPPSYGKLNVLLPTELNEEERNKENKIRKLAKLCLISFSLILSAELCIVLIYWTTVFPSAKEWDAAELANDIHMHGVYLLMILIEYAGSTIIIRYGSFVWPLCFGIVFGSWTLIHYGAGLKDFKGNRYIYPLMNWGEYPSTAIGLWIIAIIFLPLVHLGLVKLKVKLLKIWIQKYRLKRRDSLNNNSATQDRENENFKSNMNAKLTDNNTDNENETNNNTNNNTNINNNNNNNNTNNNDNTAIEIQTKQKNNTKQEEDQNDANNNNNDES